MGNLFKKRDNEPIKKVRVRLACACSGQNCRCGCVATESTKYDTTTTSFGSIDAELCKGIYDYKYENYPIS